MKKFKKYKEYLFKRLRDPETAAAYLKAALEDEDPKVLSIALKDIRDAHSEFAMLEQRSSSRT